ncbi:phosphate acyltransferase [Defluviitalea raffinosedens]|uniref:phosphate acyltransferase n=1 Tax=Defluviitalea raffinosedens TaxID=1450156 RepID=UPI00195BD9A2|nr:phosphotransacetylase [Defluviitalea raffinosedens]
MDFLQSIKQKAKACKKTIVLPESLERRTLEAAQIILQEELANIILVGNEAAILEKAEGLNISGANIVDPEHYDRMNDFVDTLVELRKSKGLTREQAEKLLKDPLYFGVMMVKKGIADGMVAGAVNSTANVLRPSLQILKTAPNTKLVSSFFVMVVPDCDFGSNGIFVFSDAGLVPNPNAEELAVVLVY